MAAVSHGIVGLLRLRDGRELLLRAASPPRLGVFTRESHFGGAVAAMAAVRNKVYCQYSDWRGRFCDKDQPAVDVNLETGPGEQNLPGSSYALQGGVQQVSSRSLRLAKNLLFA